jgi:hypothetical protein
MYKTCYISMILLSNVKHTTDITYNIQLYKYHTIHFLCGKCGVILTRQTNIDMFYYIILEENKSLWGRVGLWC